MLFWLPKVSEKLCIGLVDLSRLALPDCQQVKWACGSFQSLGIKTLSGWLFIRADAVLEANKDDQEPNQEQTSLVQVSERTIRYQSEVSEWTRCQMRLARAWKWNKLSNLLIARARTRLIRLSARCDAISNIRFSTDKLPFAVSPWVPA